MHEWIDRIHKELTLWPGVSAASHRFGGIEFSLGTVEVGHIHNNGMVDIPFNSQIRSQLLAEGKAQPHHLLPDTGWISFYIRSEPDVAGALWLFRLSYLFNAARGSRRTAINGQLDIPHELALLQPGAALQTIFTRVTRLSPPSQA